MSKWVVAGKDNTPIRRNVLLFNAAPNSWNNPNKLRKSPNWRCHRARCPGCGRLEIGFAFPHFYSAAAGTRVTRRTPGTFSPSNYFHLFQCRKSRHPRSQEVHSQVHDSGGDAEAQSSFCLFLQFHQFLQYKSKLSYLMVSFLFHLFLLVPLYLSGLLSCSGGGGGGHVGRWEARGGVRVVVAAHLAYNSFQLYIIIIIYSILSYMYEELTGSSIFYNWKRFSDWDIDVSFNHCRFAICNVFMLLRNNLSHFSLSGGAPNI